MKIHPQDEVIMALSTDDDDIQPSSKKKRLQFSEVKLNNIGTLSPDRIRKAMETQNHPSSGGIDHTRLDNTINYSDHASSVMGSSRELMKSGKDGHGESTATNAIGMNLAPMLCITVVWQCSIGFPALVL
jgi:hypothetical protein